MANPLVTETSLSERPETGEDGDDDRNNAT